MSAVEKRASGDVVITIPTPTIKNVFGKEDCPKPMKALSFWERVHSPDLAPFHVQIIMSSIVAIVSIIVLQPFILFVSLFNLILQVYCIVSGADNLLLKTTRETMEKVGQFWEKQNAATSEQTENYLNQNVAHKQLNEQQQNQISELKQTKEALEAANRALEAAVEDLDGKVTVLGNILTGNKGLEETREALAQEVERLTKAVQAQEEKHTAILERHEAVIAQHESKLTERENAVAAREAAVSALIERALKPVSRDGTTTPPATSDVTIPSSESRIPLQRRDSSDSDREIGKRDHHSD